MRCRGDNYVLNHLCSKKENKRQENRRVSFH